VTWTHYNQKREPNQKVEILVCTKLGRSVNETISYMYYKTCSFFISDFSIKVFFKNRQKMFKNNISNFLNFLFNDFRESFDHL